MPVALLAAALSLHAARLLADERNGTIQAARAAAATAHAAISGARQLANPTGTVSYGADDPKLQAGVDLKLPIFGQRGAVIATAEAQARAADAEVPVEQLRVHAAVRRTFSAAWTASRQAEIADETARLAAELARLAGERFRTGGAPQLEALQAQLARDRAAHDAEDRRAEAAASRAELSALIGAPVDELEPPPPGAAVNDAALAARAQGHPEVEALRLQRDVSLARAHEERLVPVPLPSVGVTAERFTDPSVYWGVRAAITFDLPLLSLNRGRVGEQEQAARAAQVQADAALQRLQGQVRAAQARWVAASSRAAFYGGDFLRAASQVLQMARAGYAIGRTSLVTVLQAQSDFAAAQSRAADATLEAQRALADLEEATGADL